MFLHNLGASFFNFSFGPFFMHDPSCLSSGASYDNRKMKSSHWLFYLPTVICNSKYIKNNCACNMFVVSLLVYINMSAIIVNEIKY